MSRSRSRGSAKQRSRYVEDFSSNQPTPLGEDPTSANNAAMDVALQLPLSFTSSCYICKSVVDEDLTILCDGEGCANEVHMYCLKPPLLTVPTANWYCHECDHYGATAPIRLYFDEHAATKAQHVDGSLASYEAYQALLPGSILPMEQISKALFCTVERSEFEGKNDLSGYLVEVYCPVDDVYHRGRIISKPRHHEVYNIDEYKVLFKSGIDGRNVELQREICLSEHCCIVYTDVIMTFTPSHSSYGWIPMQITLRSCLDLLLNNTTLTAVQQRRIVYSFSEDKLLILEDDVKIEQINDHRFRNRMTKAMAVAYSCALAEAEEQVSIQRAVNVCSQSLQNNCGLAFNPTRPTYTNIVKLHTQAPKKKVVTYFTAEQDAKQQIQVTTDSVNMIKSEFLQQHIKNFNLSKTHQRSVQAVDQSLVMLDVAYLAYEVDNSLLQDKSRVFGRQELAETGVLLCSTNTNSSAVNATEDSAASASSAGSGMLLPLTLSSPWTHLRTQAQAIEAEEDFMRQQQEEEKKRIKRENWYIARERLKQQREEEAQRRREKYEEKKKTRLLQMEADDTVLIDIDSKRKRKRRGETARVEEEEDETVEQQQDAEAEQEQEEEQDWMKAYGVRSPRAASIIAVDRITATANQGRHYSNKIKPPTAAATTALGDFPGGSKKGSKGKVAALITSKRQKSSRPVSPPKKDKGKGKNNKTKKNAKKKQRVTLAFDDNTDYLDTTADSDEEEGDQVEEKVEEQEQDAQEQEQEVDDEDIATSEQLDSFVVELDPSQLPQAETQHRPQILDQVHPHLWQDRLVRYTVNGRLGRVVGKDTGQAIVKLLALSSSLASSSVMGELVVVDPSLLMVIEPLDEEEAILQAEDEAAAAAAAFVPPLTASSVTGALEEQALSQQQLQEDQTVISSISNDQVQDYGDTLLMQHALAIGENFLDPPTQSKPQQSVMTAAKKRERASKIQYLDLSAYSTAQSNVMARRPLLNSKLNPVAAPVAAPVAKNVAATASSKAIAAPVMIIAAANSSTTRSAVTTAPQQTGKEYTKFGRGSFKFSSATTTATVSSTSASKPQQTNSSTAPNNPSVPLPVIDLTSSTIMMDVSEPMVEAVFSPIFEAPPQQQQQQLHPPAGDIIAAGGVRRSRFDPRLQRHQQPQPQQQQQQQSSGQIVPSFSPISSPRPVAEESYNHQQHQQYLYPEHQLQQQQMPVELQLPPPAMMQDDGTHRRSSRSRTRFSRFDNPAASNDYALQQQQAQQSSGMWSSAAESSFFQDHGQHQQQQQWNDGQLQQQQQQGYDQQVLWQQQQQQQMYSQVDFQYQEQQYPMMYDNSTPIDQSSAQYAQGGELYFQQPPVAPTLQVPAISGSTAQRKAIAIAPTLPEQPSDGLTKAQRRRMKRSGKSQPTHLPHDIMENETSGAAVPTMMTTRRGKTMIEEAEEGEVLDEERL